MCKSRPRKIRTKQDLLDLPRIFIEIRPFGSVRQLFVAEIAALEIEGVIQHLPTTEMKQLSEMQ